MMNGGVGVRGCRSWRCRRRRCKTHSAGAAAVLFNNVAFLSSCTALLLLAQAMPAAYGARDSSKGYDADLTLFSPAGRLYQVEYVMRAVGQYGCPAVGVQGEGCCVVACRKDLPDELIYPESVTAIFRITDDIYAACIGMDGDARYQVKRARLQSLEYKRQYGSPMPSRLLTLAMADAAQVNTQHAAMRPMACVSFIISIDDPGGPLLFRVEPSGQVYQAWGTAAGRGSAASLEFLEETIKTAKHLQQGEEDTSDYSESDNESGQESDKTYISMREDKGKGKGGENDGSRRGELSARARERGVFPDGMGVRGEEETVGLALRALSKASPSPPSSSSSSSPRKSDGLLTQDNVEIAIASADTGIRVCSRAEVKGFLGRMITCGK